MSSHQDNNNINIISECNVSPYNDITSKFPKEEKTNIMTNSGADDAELAEVLQYDNMSRVSDTVSTSETLFPKKDEGQISKTLDYKEDTTHPVEPFKTSQESLSLSSEEAYNASNDISQIKEPVCISQQFPCTISADRFLCMDIKSCCLTKRSSTTDINAVKLLEQNTIDLKRNNIDLKNSLKELNRKYNFLCETVRQVKSELHEISLNETTKEPLSDQFRNIKISCEHIMKILNNVNALLQ